MPCLCDPDAMLPVDSQQCPIVDESEAVERTAALFELGWWVGLPTALVAIAIEKAGKGRGEPAKASKDRAGRPINLF